MGQGWSSQFHDDVIKWEHFSHSWPLWGESTGHRWIPPTKPVTQSFDVFFDLRLNKRLSKQSRRRWLGTSSRSLWRHSNDDVCWWRFFSKRNLKSIISVHLRSAPVWDRCWTNSGLLWHSDFSTALKWRHMGLPHLGLKSPAIQFPIEQLVQAYEKENFKTLHNCSFVGESASAGDPRIPRTNVQ